MSNLKSIFTLILALALPSLAAAEQKSGGKQTRPPITLTKENGSGHLKRPKAPDRQSITCSYDGMIIDNNLKTIGWNDRISSVGWKVIYDSSAFYGDNPMIPAHPDC